MNEEGTIGIASPLFVAEVAYRTIQEKSTGACSSHLAKEEGNIYPLPVLSMCSSSGFDPLETELFTDETIMEVMCPIEKPWEISHHRSSFIPTKNHSKRFDLELTMRKECDWFKNPFLTKLVFVEGNLSNIFATIPINISSNPNVTGNILIGANLRAIFNRCWKYKIRLNSLKCSFCVIEGRLLGFIISKHGIMVDPLKVEVILQLSPLHTIRQLQSIYEAPFSKFPTSTRLEIGPNNSLFLSLVCDLD